MKYVIGDFLNRRDPELTNSQIVNMDITNKCTLACAACSRVKIWNNKPPGGPISLEDFEKYVDKFDSFEFCGQVSDPTMHPDLKGLLSLVIKNNKHARVHTAASHRPVKWYKELFEETSNDNIHWLFGIDGLPEESHNYRVRQDGVKVFEMMKLATEYFPPTKIIWKYIVFKYNENHIEECKQMANELGIVFNVVLSRRFPDESFRPSPEFVSKRFMENSYFWPSE